MTNKQKTSRASLGGKARAAKLSAKARKDIASSGYWAMIAFAVNKGALRRANQRTNTGGSKRRAKAAKQLAARPTVAATH